MSVHIEVTAQDIADGARGESDSCPIALAVERTLGVVPHVSEFDVSLGGRFDEAIVDLPDEAVDFIADFDAGLRPGPFAFDLEVPE